MKFRLFTATSVAAATLALAACADIDVSADVDSDTQAVMDRVAIEDMVIEYYAHLGGGEASAFGDYFTEDAIFDVNGIVANGREEIEAIYEGIGEDDTSASNGGGQFHMILSNPVIKVEGDNATAQFLWTGIRNADISAPPVLVEQGREYDKLQKVDGKWLFTHRVVIAESGLPEGQYEGWTPRLDFSFEAE